MLAGDLAPGSSITLVLVKQAKASLKSRIPVKIRASIPRTVVTATENFSVRYKTQVQAMMIKVMVLWDIGNLLQKFCTNAQSRH